LPRRSARRVAPRKLEGSCDGVVDGTRLVESEHAAIEPRVHEPFRAGKQIARAMPRTFSLHAIAELGQCQFQGSTRAPFLQWDPQAPEALRGIPRAVGSRRGIAETEMDLCLQQSA